ncbi:MAG: hypothetical protein RIB63_05215, partial [Fulvivirga sp.]
GIWPLDGQSLLLQISNTEMYTALHNAVDPLVIESIRNEIFYTNIARLVLLILFVGITTLVYIAHKRRTQEK